MSNLSYKDYTGIDLRDRPDLLAELKPGTIIDRTSFASETIDSVFLPDDAAVTLKDCNLTNRIIPKGCTVIGGTQQRFIVIDGVDTLVDVDGNPTGPLDDTPPPEPKLDDYPQDKVEAMKQLVLDVFTGKKTVSDALTAADTLALDVSIDPKAASLEIKGP